MKVSLRSFALIGLLFCLPGFAGAQTAIQSGNKLYAQQKYELAIREYEHVAEADDEYPTAIYNIGVCKYELWLTDDAIGFYRHAIKLRRGNYSKASFALAIALEEQNKLAEAREAYLQSIRTAADEYPWAKFKLGLLEANEGNLELAARLFKEAGLKSGEHTASSHNNLGVVFARMGRLLEAEKEFRVALRQAGGQFTEASDNLKLCRSLLLTAENLGTLSMSTPKFFR